MEIKRKKLSDKLNHYLDYLDYLLECEQYNIAIKNIEKINRPDILNLNFKKAYCLYKLEKYSDAIKEFNKCLKFDKLNSECICFIGLSLIKKNNINNGSDKIEKEIINKLIVNKYNNNTNNHLNLDDDILCCPLTLDKFSDPYITTYGNTYEHAALTEHLKDVGKFDPLTREYLDDTMIFPNRKIKELLQKYN